MILPKTYPKQGAIAQSANYLTEYYHNSDELRRLLEMAEIATFCHNLTPIKAFLWFKVNAVDSGLKRLLWRLLIFDKPNISPGISAMMGAIVGKGGRR